MTTDCDIGVPGNLTEDTYTEKQRDLLRAWVMNRHTAYVKLALEIAGIELNKNTKGPDADLSYDKLRRRRQEYEECRSVLSVLSQRF